MRYLQALVALVLLSAVALCPQPSSAEIIHCTPKLPPKGSFVVSLSGTWMVEQQFKRQDSYSASDSSGFHGTLHDPKWDFKLRDDQYYMMKFAYGIFDRMDVYAKVGVVTGGKLENNRLYSGGGSVSDTEKLDTNLVWAVGVEGKVLEFGGNHGGIMLGVEYLRYDDRKVSYDSGPMGPYIKSDEGSLDYWQVDVSAILYLSFPWFTPYFGMAYTYSETNYDLRWQYVDGSWETAQFDLRDKDVFMPIAGAYFPITDHFTIDLQATFVARAAGTLSLSYCF